MLHKKLRGLQHAARNIVLPDSLQATTPDRWVLHVLAPSSKVARIIRHAYKRLPPELHVAAVIVTVVRLDSVFWGRARRSR